MKNTKRFAITKLQMPVQIEGAHYCFKLGVFLVLGCWSLVLLPCAFAQGSLTPPGPPAPTMKTLQQIEPRTPITQASVPFTISAPGSYYVTEDLTVASGNVITIAASGVSLDLGGFSLSTTANPAAGTAVLFSGAPSNVSIRNGHILGGVTYNGSSFTAGPGFGNGIYAVSASDVLVEHVTVSGCSSVGIYLYTSPASIVRNCAVNNIGQTGIDADAASDSAAETCGAFAISAADVRHCHASAVGSGEAISCRVAKDCWGSGGYTGIVANVASDCYGTSTSGDGIYTFTAANCYGTSKSGRGIFAANAASNCYGLSGSDSGIFAANATNCMGESTSGTGMTVTANATNCYGDTGGGAGVFGMNVYQTASYCRGQSFGGATGLTALIAIGCTGSSSSGTAITATHKYLSGIGPDS